MTLEEKQIVCNGYNKKIFIWATVFFLKAITGALLISGVRSLSHYKPEIFFKITVICTILLSFVFINITVADNNKAFSQAFAQEIKENETDSSLDFKIKVKLTPYIPDYKDLGINGRLLVYNRLNSILSQFEDCNINGNPRFIIGTAINLVEKKVISGKKIRFSNTYELTLTSADIVNKTVFATYTTTINGLDDSPVKTFINGFRAVNFENKEFIKFLSKTQNQIFKYYDFSCGTIINDAQTEAGNKNFDAAHLILKNIPEKSQNCYKQSLEKKAEYSRKFIGINCKTLADKMKAQFAKNPAESAAAFNDIATINYLLIDKKSGCFEEADSVYKNYVSRLNPQVKTEWEKMQKMLEEEINTPPGTGAAQDSSSKAPSTSRYYKYITAQLEKSELTALKKLIKKYHLDNSDWITNTFHTTEYEPFTRNDY